MKKINTISPEQKYTIKDFNTEFPTDDACIVHIFLSRWPDGRTMCGKCRVERKHYRVTGRTAFACDHCGNHIYPLAGTIFEKSTTSLRLWFHAMVLMGSTPSGVSAKQIERETGVTYKTAWRMLKQIRTLMFENVGLEEAAVEMNETSTGGRRSNSRHGPPPVGDHKQTCVVGAVEPRGRVGAIAANDALRKTFHGIGKEYILLGSLVYIDELSSYNGLENVSGYQRRKINQANLQKGL